MGKHGNRLLPISGLALLVLLLLAGDSAAYVGPGPEFIGYFGTLVTWLVVAFSAVLLWPVYAVLRLIRGVPEPSKSPPAEAIASAPDASPAASS